MRVLLGFDWNEPLRVHTRWIAVALAPKNLGGWTPTLIGAQGRFLNGIDNVGTFAVGATTAGNSTSAAYWTRSGSTWSGPGGCLSSSRLAHP